MLIFRREVDGLVVVRFQFHNGTHGGYPIDSSQGLHERFAVGAFRQDDYVAEREVRSPDNLSVAADVNRIERRGEEAFDEGDAVRG